MSYGGLRRQVATTFEARWLRSVVAGNRIAVVLPNGPEMAAVALAARCDGVCAPIDPGDGAEAIRFCRSGPQAGAESSRNTAAGQARADDVGAAGERAR